ncbi:Nif3-like dinuclear metal center hexameric protein [Schaalia sp. lx-260]|uniref:Nif3-like dinuclear metal center hexameric protein n=1 Tax=Schaalia sp. lx-260 TaxID=2899082 RepID=UPI001E52FC45|nr:Nif3-like dinuclear metal center hexameric protein [Schaalia sp. lx-260]MCD4549342.1 Nif3-like dinuclear metal center hexameric protein [Schaalia sp. lx-260]
MSKLWTVSDVIAMMERWYPSRTAHTWDRVGLVLGNPQQPVKRILLAVDPVKATVNEAISGAYDMLLTHHPLYLRGTSFLPENDPKGRMVASLIRANIALYTAHTNADIAHKGVADALGERLGLRDMRPLISEGYDTEKHEIGTGRIGCVETTTVTAFADHVARVLPAGTHGLFIGGDIDAPVRTVAVSGGAGDQFLDAARQAKADVYLTADLRHHPASEHCEKGTPALFCASHWATEWPWLPVLANRIQAEAAAENVSLSVEVSTMCTEPWIRHQPTLGGLQ